MKLLTVEEAQAQFAAVCQEAVEGEVIQFQLANGALIQLTPVPAVAPVSALSDRELAECYEDKEWAAFENHVGQASD